MNTPASLIHFSVIIQTFTGIVGRVALSGCMRSHTQDSGMLEKDKAHDPEQVARFLRLWAPAALRAEHFQE
jgi:hypothetical protein